MPVVGTDTGANVPGAAAGPGTEMVVMPPPPPDGMNDGPAGVTNGPGDVATSDVLTEGVGVTLVPSGASEPPDCGMGVETGAPGPGVGATVMAA